MQRSAWAVAAAGVCLALLGGCQTGQKHETPPPEPILSTRTPVPIAPAPRPEPAPGPAETGAVRLSDIMPPGGIQRGRWQQIVVHHAAADGATPQGMDAWHRQRGWSGGLGYHFVIGNGVKYPDGQLFVGPRWKTQSTGAHCKSSSGRYLGVYREHNYFNEHGIGICLIGDFQHSTPTARQLRTLRDLITLLIRQTGMDPGAIHGHGEITHKTECPGRNMNMAALRRSVASALGSARPLAKFDAWDSPELYAQYADDEPCDELCGQAPAAEPPDGVPSADDMLIN